MNQKHLEGSKGKKTPSKDKTPVAFEEDQYKIEFKGYKDNVGNNCNGGIQ